jgi:hypothetical protein
MLTYWLMYFSAAMMALGQAGKRARSSGAAWIFAGLALILIIGFRSSGGDWYNYLKRFEQMSYLTFDEALAIKDPGYQLISYYVYSLGWDFWVVTLICATISVTGLIIFLRRQINPWLGLAISIPYLVIVVYMGYMRQGVALGLVMWGLAYLDQGKFIRFLIFVSLAVTFHKSAILMIAFGIFQQGKGKILKVLAVAMAGVGIWSAFVEKESTTLWKNYVEAEMQSQGAMIRASLNMMPALLLLYFRKKWKYYFDDYGLWVMIALASLSTIFLVPYASTAVDRMALYFLPLQLVVFSRLPLLARGIVSPNAATTLVLLLYFAILFVWLNFGANSRFWIPYSNQLFSGAFWE